MLWIVVQILNGDRKINRVAGMLRSGAVASWNRSLHATYYRAMSQYLPPEVRTEVVCLVCEEYSEKWGYQAQPWNNLCANVLYARIPGGHHTCLVDHIGELAARLNGTVQHG